MIFKQMQQETHELLHQIQNLPFNIQLASGTLDKDIFIFYLLQDALYLADYSRALSMTAARLPKNLHTQQFIHFALDAIKAERELHHDYLRHYNIKEGFVIEASPACFMYTNFLLKTSSLASVEEAVASLLPCFFVYLEVGKNMVKHLRPNHPYYDWISMYSGESFEASVQLAIDITDELANEASTTIKKKMLQAYFKATQLEWIFWDSAYQKEQWLIK